MTTRRPKHGDVIKSDGTVVNEADELFRRRKFDLFYQIEQGNAYLFSCRFDVAGNSTVWVALELNGLTQVRVYDRLRTAGEGEWNLDIARVSGIGNEQQSTKFTENVDGETVGGIATFNVDPDAITEDQIIEYGYRNVGSNQPSRTAADAVDDSKVFLEYGNDTGYKFEKLDSGSSICTFKLLFVEVE